MICYRYRLILYDPLYYAREGLFGAFTPPVMQGTAINHAVTAALNLHPENQPFIMAESNGGMDVPRYADSRASPLFYCTPGAPSTLRDWTEIVKGDNDGFTFKVLAGEILKATHVHFLPPETEFGGFAIGVEDSFRFPAMIRLGSFRGMARLAVEPADSIKLIAGPAMVDHPVDPFVSQALRGVMLNLFPYPLVQNAVCRKVYELRFERPTYGPTRARLAWPDGYAEPAPVERLHGPTAIV